MNRFIILIITIIFGSSVSMAQGNMPEISLAPGQIQGFVLDQTEKNDVFLVKNALMRDIIILQNQVNILEGLVERQSEVEDIALNYERIGVPFRQPKPPKSTCEKLPLNVLCLFFYPELSINQSIVSESIGRYEARQQQQIDEAIEQLRRQVIEDVRLRKSQGKSVETRQKSQYFWSDIQCKNNQCSAVIENNIDSNDKSRVKSGDIHINGLKITKIDPREGIVMAMYDGKKVEIKPLSLSGSSPVNEREESNSNVFNEDEIVDLLRENISDASSGSPTSQVPVSSAPPSMPVTNTQEPLPEMLGATGLF